jgi:solute carrier family 36 (proton-coupled amino acid transporter)
MNAFETYIAIIKGYCALMILVLPKAFSRGGYIFSPIAMIISGPIQMLCAIKLVHSGQKLGLKSYSLIALKALGPNGKTVLDTMIAMTQFSFSLSLCSFITSSIHSILRSKLGLDVDIWTVAFGMLAILIPISWVRNISKFSFTFLIGNVLILATIISVTVVMSVRVYDRGGLGPGIQAVNGHEYWGMIGFSCYAFEGIGVVMPIMSACECPEKFDKILFAALLTLTVVYCLFGNFCYMVLGTDLDTTFIT